DDQLLAVVGRDAGGQEVDAGGEPPDPGGPAQLPLGPGPSPGPDDDPIRGHDDPREGALDDEARRVADDPDRPTDEPGEELADRIRDRSPELAVEDEDGERSAGVEGRPLAGLGGLDRPSNPPGEGPDDDAAKAHRPRPADGLGV